MSITFQNWTKADDALLASWHDPEILGILGQGGALCIKFPRVPHVEKLLSVHMSHFPASENAEYDMRTSRGSKTNAPSVVTYPLPLAVSAPIGARRPRPELAEVKIEHHS